MLLAWLFADTAAPSLDWKPWLDLLLGPLGLTIGLLIVAIAFAKEWVVPGSRYRRERAESLDTIRLLTDRVDDVAKATEDRNRNEQARLDLLRGSSAGLSAGLADAEDQIRRRQRPQNEQGRRP